MSSPAHGSPRWAAEKEFALLMLLTDGNRKAAQQLWLRKVRVHREAPPDAAGSAPKAATAKPQPAPARAAWWGHRGWHPADSALNAALSLNALRLNALQD